MAAPTYNAEAIRAGVKEELHSLFFRIGYDLTDPKEMRRLEQDLEWVSKKRSKENRTSVNVTKVKWLVVTAALGSAATALSEWAARNFHL